MKDATMSSREISTQLVSSVREQLAEQGEALTPHSVAQILRAAGRPVGDAVVLAVHDALRQEVIGAGVLEPLLALPGVTDVVVNGAGAVWFDAGSGLERSSIQLPDEAAVRRLAQRLASSAGRRLDDAAPYADLRLPDGTRFHAILAPIARPGTLISLRIPRRRGFTLAQLVEAQMIPEVGAQLLGDIVTQKLAFLISGGTGSGKTTLLNSLLGLVPPQERIVIVEDSSELRPDHPHVVALEARPANIEGAGEITVRTLVRQALRMRPDRLIVGEVRGGEVVDLLAAMNTGHEGGCGTIHANSAADVPARVEGLALAAGMEREAAYSQFASAVDVIIHVHRDQRGQRALAQIGVTQRSEASVRVVTAVEFKPDGPIVGPGAARLEELLNR